METFTSLIETIFFFFSKLYGKQFENLSIGQVKLKLGYVMLGLNGSPKLIEIEVVLIPFMNIRKSFAVFQRC